MAGRGGGAGRGRASMSFSVEQLGFSAGEMLPGPVLQPPPLYPTLEFRPAPLETGPIYKEQVKFMTLFTKYLNNSSAFIQADEIQKGINNFMDPDRKLNSSMVDKPLDYDWTNFPSELAPIKKRKSSKNLKSVSVKLQKKQSANVDTILDHLEKKEVTEKDKENDNEETEKKKVDEEGEEDGEKEDIEEEDFDEEMDAGTDYISSYFDNGENYLDDSDDNLDDGPVY